MSLKKFFIINCSYNQFYENNLTEVYTGTLMSNLRKKVPRVFIQNYKIKRQIVEFELFFLQKSLLPTGKNLRIWSFVLILQRQTAWKNAKKSKCKNIKFR